MLPTNQLYNMFTLKFHIILYLPMANGKNISDAKTKQFLEYILLLFYYCFSTFLEQPALNICVQLMKWSYGGVHLILYTATRIIQHNFYFTVNAFSNIQLFSIFIICVTTFYINSKNIEMRHLKVSEFLPGSI